MIIATPVHLGSDRTSRMQTFTEQIQAGAYLPPPASPPEVFGPTADSVQQFQMPERWAEQRAAQIASYPPAIQASIVDQLTQWGQQVSVPTPPLPQIDNPTDVPGMPDNFVPGDVPAEVLPELVPAEPADVAAARQAAADAEKKPWWTKTWVWALIAVGVAGVGVGGYVIWKKSKRRR